MNSLHYNYTSVVVEYNLQAGSQFGVASPPYYFVLSYIVTNEVLAYLSNSSVTNSENTLSTYCTCVYSKCGSIKNTNI